MKKEKKIKAHTRRTKSGKTITVKAHTAKYDAAEELKKAAKKKGAGDELEERKKEKFMVLGVDLSVFSDEELKELDFIEYDDNGKAVHAPKTRSGLKRFAEKYYSDPDSADNFREGMADFYAEVKERRKAKKSSEAKVPKSSKNEAPSLKSKPTKKSPNSYEQYGFTKEEFAEWYEGTGSKADKKVEKALRKAMGSKAYNDLSDSAADSYKAGGADAFFKKGIKKMQATTNSSKNGTSKIELNELTYYGWELIPKRVEESAKAKTSTGSKSASKKMSSKTKA